jgi:hypothetical protein
MGICGIFLIIVIILYFYNSNNNYLAYYTYFIGSNSNNVFKIPPIPSNKYDCYYFTNNETLLELIKKTKWIPVFIDINTTKEDDFIVANMIGKHIKTKPHEYKELNKYKYLCYLDSKLNKLNEDVIMKLIIDKFINDNYAIILRKHTFLDNIIWSEFNESMKQERYVYEKNRYLNYINKQLNDGLKENTAVHCQTGLIIRNMKHKKINDINNTWYSHIQECGIQDQISFFFVKQLFEGYYYAFTEIPFI